MNDKRRQSGYSRLKQLAQSGAKTPAIGPIRANSVPQRGQHATKRTAKATQNSAKIVETPLIEPKISERRPAQQLVIDMSADGQRVDNYLLRVLKGVPRSLVYRILRSGEVRVNGSRAKPERRLASGDNVRVPPLRLGESVAKTPETGQIDWLAQHVLADERDIIVLNKPSGLASHGGSGLSFGAIEAMRALYPNDTLELVHRLDRDTSGLLLFAKKRSALTQLQTLMREGGIRKVYLALAHGLPAKDRFEVSLKLKKFDLAGGERIVKVSDAGKPALSYFRVLERFPANNACLLEVTLGTGRTHQIRVHAQAVDLPLAGDDKYHGGLDPRGLSALGLKRLFLHAHSLRWRDAEQERRYQAELPDDLLQVLQRLRQRAAATQAASDKS